MLLTCSAALALEPNPGTVYAGGTKIEDPASGAALVIPNGWRGSLPPGAEVFVLEHEADPKVHILAFLDEGVSEADLTTQMATATDLGDGISLHPTGTIDKRGPAFRGRYQVQGAQQPMLAYGEGILSPSGVAVVYVLIAPSASLSAHEPTVQALVASTNLGTGAAAPSTRSPNTSGATSGSGDRWDLYLKGKYIVRYYTASGYTDEQHIWLCSDGTFQRRGAGGGFGGGASGAVQADSTGRWTATGAGADGSLILTFGDNSTSTYQLRWDYGENKLYVDGKRWLHGTNEVCN